MLLGVMSPGPDNILVLRNALHRSRRHGFFTSFGIIFGNMFHIAISFLGLRLILTEFSHVNFWIQSIGGLYLLWLGIDTLRSTKPYDISDVISQSTSNSLAEGFFCNLLNINCFLFYSAFFSQLLPLNYSISFYISLIIQCLVIISGWFLSLSILSTHPLFLPFLLKSKRIIMIIFAIGLFIFGALHLGLSANTLF